jgi:hypothetical protein
VYLNAECNGIVLGAPSKKLMEETLSEFIKLYKAKACVKKIFVKDG